MIARGQTIGYKASVTIDANMLTCQTTFPNTLQAFIQAMTSKLETAGLLLVNYTTKKAVGSHQIYCYFMLQATQNFPSKQAIVNRVNDAIAQETGTPVRIGLDPCLYEADCGSLICSETGACATPWYDKIKNFLFVTPPPPLIPGATVGKCNPIAMGQCAGTATATAASNAATAVKNALPTTGSWVLIGVGVLLIGLLVVFVASAGKSVVA